MRKLVHLFSYTFFSSRLDFRVRLFNVLAMAGAFVAFVIGLVTLITRQDVVTAMIDWASAIAALGLLYYSVRTQRYVRCYFITIFTIFLGLFPYLYFSMGGYKGGMPMFFIFAVVFTAFMLEKKPAIFTILLELVVYTGCFVVSYLKPDFMSVVIDETGYFLNNLMDFTAAAAALAVIALIHFQLYNRQQRDLEAAREEAIKHTDAKSAFLANMSHEIRTPINIMLGMTEMVLRDSNDETVSEYAKKIQNAGSMLLVLVSNILDMSKIESGKLVMSQDAYPIITLISELREIGTESARKRQLDFFIQVDEVLPSELWGDLLRIKQIVSNFLSNAAKYTTSGSITLSFSRKEGNTEEEIILCVSVADTGIGIKQEDISLLFDAFTRVELPKYQNIEGTGLGLAIAKDLTSRMGGEVFVESEWGTGSVFRVEIPQKTVNDTPIGDWRIAVEKTSDRLDESFTAPDARVLIVDDNTENLQTVEALLRRTLMQVETARSGEECLEAVRTADYHLILMDYMMPDMDGIEVFRRLKEDVADFSVPVIAFTANAVAGAEDKFLREGFAAYISKPVKAWELEEALARLLPAGFATRRVIHSRDWASPELLKTLEMDLDRGGVSLQEGLKNTGGDLSLLARMAEIFARNNPDSFSKMKSAFMQNGTPSDYKSLRHLAHSLKSSAGFVGATGLSYIAKRVELECGSQNQEIIELAIPLLYIEWERAKDCLTEFAAHVYAVEPREGRA